MNRELKFRVWNNEQKKFEYFELRNITVPDRLLCQDKYPVQQFTGFKDSNGVDVYEGDRIRYNLYYYDEVKWEHNSWHLLMSLKDFEVVGNIFQLPCNPDHNGECLVCDCWLSDCEFLNKEKD